jgi:hypothetical protein
LNKFNKRLNMFSSISSELNTFNSGGAANRDPRWNCWSQVNAAKLSRCGWPESADVDSRRLCVLNASVGGPFNEVGVVARTFDDSGIGAVAASGIHFPYHFLQGFSEFLP